MNPLVYFNALSKFVNGDDSGYIMMLLSRIQFNNLKTLAMTHAIFDLNSILEIIEQTPSLTEFHVQAWTMTTVGLEHIHSILPLLTKLAVRTYWLYSNIFPKNIEAKPLVKSLHMEYVHAYPDLEARSTFLEHYVAKKYTDLSDPQYGIKLDVGDRRRALLERASPTPDLLEKRLGALFRTLGPKLDRISITSPTIPENIFEMMDRYNCKPSTISLRPKAKNTMLRSLLQSNQTYSIRKLVLSKIDMPMQVLCRLENLEDLSIDFEYPSLSNMTGDISSLIDMCQLSLKALTLSKAVLVSKYTPPERPQLERMTFYDCIFKEKVDGALTVGFPQLKHISVNYCTFEENAISLLSINLVSFRAIFDIESCLQRSCFTVKTLREKNFYFKETCGDE
jgi:hypothetical protein